MIKGPATGTDYRFSGLERLQLVDPRDAVAMVRDPMFRIEAIIELPTSEIASPRNGDDGDA